MNKKIIGIFFLLLFFLQLISSLELGLSPAYLDLEGKAEEKVCQNVSVYADRDINVTIKDKWTKIDGSRKIKDYNLSREDINIKVISPERIPISAGEKRKIEVCFSGKNAGNFYGAILFESDRGYANIGSWVNLKITKSQKNNIISLTGEVIGEVKGNNLLFIGLFSIVIEGFVLFLLVRKIRKKRPKMI
jgi:hypothetical protein